MNIFASDILFYVFGALAVVLSLMVVFMRNPVSSAMMMALSFGATAAVMIGLGAHFLGILQILVYAGAIMVLFAFIIMLLNVKQETSPSAGLSPSPSGSSSPASSWASLSASSILCPAPKKRTAVRWPARNRPGTI